MLLGVQDHEPIRGARLIFRCSIFSRVGLRALIAVAVLWIAPVDVNARDQSKEWIVIKDCRLIANPANDGDSFHVSAGDKEYLFRLYFVDAPETDAMIPGRLVEQGKYFEITVPQAIEVGRAANEFAREKLSEPFTVFTHMSDAMGQSKIERFYAFVQTKEGDLGEQLVRNGLARIYGRKVIPPGSFSSQPERQRLQQCEDEARREEIGGWGIKASRLNVRAEKPNRFTVFAPQGTRSLRTASVPSVSPSFTPSTTSVPTATAAASIADETNARSPDEEIASGKININTATEKELQTVPGIGPVTARKIIEARPFRSADDLRRVNGIGDKKYEVIRPYFQ